MKERLAFPDCKCLLLVLLLAGGNAAATGVLPDVGQPSASIISAGASGLWFNPAQSGHGLLIEVIDTTEGLKLLVYWFTYLDGEQVWLGGVGEIEGDSSSLEMSVFSGGRFPPDFDSSMVLAESWGELSLVFLDDNRLSVSWASGLAGFGSGSLEMEQLTRVDSFAAGASCLAGAYLNTEQVGHGILVDISRGQSGEDIAVVTWFTYGSDGHQAWLQGQGVLKNNQVQLNVLIPLGGDFPPRFQGSDVQLEPWGLMLLKFNPGGSAVELSWETDFGNFTGGSMVMQQLTVLSGHVCSGLDAPPYAAIDPSAGSGGGFPGFINGQVTVAGLGEQDYFLFVPETYQVEQSMPIMLVLHGAAGPGNASSAAQQVLTAWSEVAAREGFLVVAQVATGNQGGWIPANAELIMATIFFDLEDNYNVDRGRRFGWGFSAGGHVMHDVVLASASEFAGYAVNAGVLDALAGSGAPAAASRQVPVSITVGNRDPLQPFALVDRQRFEAAGWIPGENLFYQEFSGVHSFNITQLGEHWQHLKHFTRP
jgi:poly(3-hydroxybutyrate) depolymerase